MFRLVYVCVCFMFVLSVSVCSSLCVFFQVSGITESPVHRKHTHKTYRYHRVISDLG